MKRILFLLPFLIMLVSSCMKSANVDPTPLPNLTGNWSGYFYKLRINAAKTGMDTANKVALSLSLNSTTGYTISGDTATVHGGSFGGYQYDYSTFLFGDKSYNVSLPQTKVHLDGYYDYLYTAAQNRLQISYEFANDTLVYYYDFRKQ
ncbi:hypothetical protein C8P68_106266 [Mucilaginibacter yixingensis]|uniref:Lipocalin-like protein n=1 Tax=Mucilaginibacter yixingensis TaxID=1295612 RepID=A0A2T5J7I5_9SPHI|nr:hypothetical protein [Mucilaginibacter yixingensis]PTQ95051.1 hypothetical protein C8P68_106266 [Mucilaginibacter yixingensis]